MKERIRRIPLSVWEGDTLQKADLSEYRYRLIGLVEYRGMPGQGDVEHRWIYLCRDQEGAPVLIAEVYDLSVWGGTDLRNISRDRLYLLTEEPLTQAEFERWRALAQPLDAEAVHLPITLFLPAPPLPEIRATQR